MLTETSNGAQADDVHLHRPEPDAERHQPRPFQMGPFGFQAVDPQAVQQLPARIVAATGCSWARAAAAAGQLLCLVVLVCDSQGDIDDAKALGSRNGGVGYRHEIPGGNADAWTKSRKLLIDGGFLTVKDGYLVRIAPSTWRSLTVPKGDPRYWVPVQRHALRQLRDRVSHPRGDVAARRLFLSMVLATTRGHDRGGLVDHDGYLLASRADLAQALQGPLTTIDRLVDHLLTLGVIDAPVRPRGNAYRGPAEARPGRLPHLLALRCDLTGRVADRNSEVTSVQQSRAPETVPVHPTPPTPNPTPSERAERRTTETPSPCPFPDPLAAGSSKEMAKTTNQAPAGTPAADRAPIDGPSTTNPQYTRDGRRYFPKNHPPIDRFFASFDLVAAGRRLLGPAIREALNAVAVLIATPNRHLTPDQRDLRDHGARAARLLELAVSEAPHLLADIARREVSPEATHTQVLAWAMHAVSPHLDEARRNRARRGRTASASPATTTVLDLTKIRVGSAVNVAPAPAPWALDVTNRLLLALRSTTPGGHQLREALSLSHPTWRDLAPQELALRLEAEGSAQVWGARADGVLGP